MLNAKKRNRIKLHMLLQANTDGLQIAEIADLLQLNDDQCKSLIAEEEARGTVEFKIDSFGIALYFSKRKVQLTQESIPNLINTFAKIMVATIILFMIFGIIFELSKLIDANKKPHYLANSHIELNSYLEKNAQSKSFIENQKQQYNVDLSKYAKAKIINKEISEYKAKKSDLEKRIKLMEAQKYNCYQDWVAAQPCYITNRLLSKEEFERELAEMKFEASKLTELISLYKK